MMAKRLLRVTVMWLATCGVVGPTRGQETTGTDTPRQVPLRSFSRFEFDPVTADNVWGEAAAATFQNQRPEADPSYSAHTAFLRLAYGRGAWEGGLIFPFNNGFCVGSASDDCYGSNGIGDLSLYGKMLPLSLEVDDWLIRGGAGFNLSTPTGNENEGLGTGEVGMLPFVTVGAEYKDFAIRAHGGYEFFSASSDTARELVVYGGGLYYRVNDQLAFRSDFVAAMVNSGGGPYPTSATWDPGADVRFPIAAVDLLLRLSPSIGMTQDSPEWGFGGGLAVTWGWDPF